MPAGAEFTVPEPVPVWVTVRLNCSGTVAVKVATQVELALTTIEVLGVVPVQLPDQPVNVESTVAVAVSVTAVFCA